MNDKYKELYHKATELCHVGSAWEWEKEYARLIIQECISVSPSGDANFCISEHFGLED